MPDPSNNTTDTSLPSPDCQSEQITQFNNMLNDAKERVSCDSSCQHRRKASELKKRYEFAKTHMNSDMINQAQKNFIVFAKGQPVYDEMHYEQLKRQAQIIGKAIADKFHKEATQIVSDIKSYAVLLLNYPNVLALFKTYTRENIAMKKRIKEDGNDILTNERKTFYESQGNETLNTFYYVLTIIYIIVLLVFLGCIFKMPSEMGLMVKLGIFVGLIVLYFVSPYILSAIISSIYYIYSIMPKDVHLTV
jgi:hypothetical protein